MSRPVPLLKQAALPRFRPEADARLQHQSLQLSLFADTDDAATTVDAPATPGLDVVEEQQRQEHAWRSRQDLLRAAQLALAAQQLWGFPNLIRNPDGPWQDLRGAACDPHASRQCWPAYYLLRAGADGIQRIIVHVRPGCDGIPAVPRAAAVLADLAPVSIAACTLSNPRHEAS
jgi:hypothetical protein